MYKVSILPQWTISHDGKAAFDTATLLAMLRSIQEHGSIARAAKDVDLSYRYAWGLLREAEAVFGRELMSTGRGRGTRLTPLAEQLIRADRRIAARLSPTLESLASELETELGRTLIGKSRSLRLDASHGFAVAAFLARLEKSGIPVELRYRNSTDAAAALSRRECDLAGFHVPLGEHQAAAVARYGRWLDPKLHSLLHLAVRSQGLFVAPGNPLGLTGLADLARDGVRFVNRQAGSGTRMLLELMLEGSGIAPQDIGGFENAEFTHSAVAAYIASGMADVGIGVQTAAERFGLDFVPLVRERYFLALPTASMDDPLMRQAVEVLRSPAFMEEVDRLPGYDSTGTGELLSLTEAFGDRQPPKTHSQEMKGSHNGY